MMNPLWPYETPLRTALRPLRMDMNTVAEMVYRVRFCLVMAEKWVQVPLSVLKSASIWNKSRRTVLTIGDGSEVLRRLLARRAWL